MRTKETLIAQQRWKEPQYSKKEINAAGEALRLHDISEEEKKYALTIIDNWRTAHAYPLHVFYMNLRRMVSSRSDIIVVERLKRLESIVGKIDREKGMQLYRMQDLGGCRMIVPTLDEIYQISNKIKNSRIRHELKKVNDYIIEPKKSGYRSLHMIYRFHSDTEGKEKYNEYPMLIELQFRTHLQHIWATAVETLGLFTNQAIKAGQGSDSIKRFFVVSSSLLALREGCPVVPGTSDNQSELVAELYKIDAEEHVLESLKAIRLAIYHESSNIPDKQGYYILRLNFAEHKLFVQYFKPSEFNEANDIYNQYEEKQEENVDVVLIRASSFSTAKDAYPNYFMDIEEFISIISEYLELEI